MKVFKNIRKNNGTSQILFSWDGHNKSTLHSNGFNSLGRTTTFEYSFFSIPFPFFWHFSLRSLPTLPFSEYVFFWHFSLRSLPTLPFSEFPFFWEMKFFSAKPTVFRRLRRLQMPKRIRSESTDFSFTTGTS